MSEKLKIIIPMAGFGSRLRPHTWSRPKQLISIAGKCVLDHLLAMFETLPDPENIELIFIVGYLGNKIETYMARHHPDAQVRFIVQDEMRGQSHAIHLAKDYLTGPMLMVFADTLIETNLSFLADERADAVAWVKPVPDPRRFGVTKIGENDWVTRLIEKPKEVHNNLALVGFYYFKQSEDLIAAIEAQFEQDHQLQGEFYLADAINIMIERGLRMRTERVTIWLDAGTPEAVLETNRYLLDNGHASEPADKSGNTIIQPVFVHPDAKIEASVIGPYTSIGAGCTIKHSIIQDTILEDNAQAENIILKGSLIGKNTRVSDSASSLNLGDNSDLQL